MHPKTGHISAPHLNHTTRWLKLTLLLGVFACMPVTAYAERTPSPSTETVSLGETQDGSLLLKTDVPGEFIKAPMVATDVDIDVAGSIIRSKVTQSFKNNTSKWVEGIYVFPLPENASVDRLKMIVGGRMIEGQIKEKQQAKKIYEQAKKDGKKASLVTQERPNIFTSSVANIGPGETVSIQIEYQDKVRIQDGTFSFRFPMTVAPRFSPPRETVKLASAGGDTTLAILDPVLDRDRISPPLMPPQDEPNNYLRLPVTIDVNLHAGFPVNKLDSPYHTVSVAKDDARHMQISLSDGPVPANKDFKLEWTAQPATEPYTEIFTETHGEDTFLLAMLTPPKTDLKTEIPTHSRESIFVIDTSGSMGGASIIQAKEALLLALSGLEPDDSFNIVQFASSHHALFTEPVLATDANVKRARQFVRSLNAKGGTQMLPALETALSFRHANEKSMRQVIFITDGSIGNEKQIFALLQDSLKDARFFPIGIGSAPNSYFMSRSAKFGHGTYVQIGKPSEVRSRMETLFKAIDNPVLTNLQSNLTGISEAYPSFLPDLYDGEPVIVAAKVPTKEMPRMLDMTGSLAGANWNMRINTDNATHAKGISTFWARQKIADLEDQRFDRAMATDIDKEILSTALNYHLVSRLTSLVAVDITPNRPIGAQATTKNVPTMLPDGWDFGALTGRQGAQQSGPKLQPVSAPRPSTRPVNLPGTASPHNMLMGLGLGLMIMFGWLSRRRRIT